MRYYQIERNKLINRHMCDEQKKTHETTDEVVIAYGGYYDGDTKSWIEKGWVFDANNDDSFCNMIIPIKYCPFCGIRL